MRLASFNIKNGLSGDGSCEPEALVGACRMLRADVLALQEVDRGVPRSNKADQTEIVADGCGLTGLYAPARRLDGGEYGNALLVRGSLADVENVRLPVLPGNEARSAVVARAEVNGLALSVAGTHLQNRHGGPPPTSKDAAEQLDQLSVVLGALASRPRPKVLLGDLNMPPEVVVPVLESAGYAVADSEPTVVVGAPKFRIDYVAVDGLAVGAGEVVDTAVSDHRAIVAEAVADPT
ncbi:MAG TPA: endonuclease/exonuclease/phosphatase family protein [Acidimicrobiia bacterium]|jgi:endonuclease/exonuclease/phosphatase family metal-dependent hydrolase|nr:endonuclease/exonuclease/phosphatase family protein [Acidimicrobiia bacterium]